MLGASSPKSRRAGVDGGTIFRGLPRRPMRLPLVACAPEPGCPCFSNPPRCVCRGFSPPSKSQTPATNADFFRPSVPNPPKAILLFPNKNFPIFPGDQVLSQAPDAPSTRIAEFDKETTRRRNSPRLGFYLQRVASARRLFSPDRGSLPKHAAPGTEQHRTSPHLTFPPPSIDLIDDRRLPCSSATFVLRRPRDSLFCPSSSRAIPETKRLSHLLFRARIDCDSQKPSALHHQRR